MLSMLKDSPPDRRKPFRRPVSIISAYGHAFDLCFLIS